MNDQPITKREPVRLIGAAVTAFVVAAIAAVNVFGIAHISEEQTVAIVGLLGAFWALLEVIRSIVTSPATAEEVSEYMDGLVDDVDRLMRENDELRGKAAG